MESRTILKKELYDIKIIIDCRLEEVVIFRKNKSQRVSLEWYEKHLCNKDYTPNYQAFNNLV